MPRSAFKLVGSARRSVLGLCLVGGLAAMAAFCAPASAIVVVASHEWSGAASPALATGSTPGNWAPAGAPASSRTVDALASFELNRAACTPVPATATCTSSFNDRAGATKTVSGTVVEPPPPDLTPPTITFMTPANGDHFTQGVSVTSAFSCADPGGSGVASCVGPATVGTATLGTRTFEVVANDVAGNTNTQSIQYIVDAPDMTDPIIGVTTPAEGEQFVQGASVASDVTCADAGSGIASCNRPATVDTSSLGAQTFVVTAIDHAGNVATTTVHYTVVTVIDHTPPTIAVTTPAAGAHFALGTVVAANAGCADPDGTGVASCVYPTNVDTAAAGTHEFKVTATDAAGNIATRTIGYSVDPPDTTPPTITVVTPAEGQHFAQGSAVETNFSCADAMNTVAPSCVVTEDVSTTSAGPHTFTVRAEDAAHNVTTKTVDYVVDADVTAPTITVTTPAEGQHFAQGATPQTHVECSDGSVGTGVASCTVTEDLTTATPGPHTFRVSATDGAGNATTKVVNYVIDAAAGDGTASGGTGTDTVGTGTGGTGTGGTGADGTGTGGTGTGGTGESATTVSLSGLPVAFTASSAGTIRVLVRCKTTVRCTGTAKITVPRRAAGARSAAIAMTIIASARYSIAAKKSARIVLRLNPIGRKRLRLSRTALKATLTLTPANRSGKVVKRTIRLKRASP